MQSTNFTAGYGIIVYVTNKKIILLLMITLFTCKISFPGVSYLLLTVPSWHTDGLSNG